MAKQTLMERMMASGAIKTASILSESTIFNDRESVATELPTLNIALSGRLNGGISSGITVYAGKSGTFKTLGALYCLKAYLDAYDDGIGVIYDAEFGITPEYLTSIGIDTKRVIHIPIENIEQLKFDMVKRLEEVVKGDHVFFMIDSLGVLPSKKEIDDAAEEKSVADMTRAKSIRSALRLITPHLSIKNIPCVIINHVYETMELYSKTIVGGGTAITYSANQILIFSKKQIKDDGELTGFEFVITINKSRTVREKTQVSFMVNFDGGIERYGGLFEIAKDAGMIVVPTQGWYSRVAIDTETGEGVVESQKWRQKDTFTPEFWNPILMSKAFTDYLHKTYEIVNG